MVTIFLVDDHEEVKLGELKKIVEWSKKDFVEKVNDNVPTTSVWQFMKHLGACYYGTQGW